MRQIVGFSADTHCGHKLGLLNPDTTLWQEMPGAEPEPYKPNPTATQTVLWPEWETNLAKMQEWANGDEEIAILVGDITSGNKHPDGNMSTRISDQIMIAYDCLLTWAMHKELQKMRLVSGTGAHDFGESSSDILVSKMLRDVTGKDVNLLGHALLNIGGVVMDVAHHGPPPGSRSWLHGNVARYYLKDMMFREVLAGRRPPRLYVRAHVHTYVRETYTLPGTDYTSDLVILPSYCGLTGYARQSSRSTPSITFGSLAAEIVDGELCSLRPLNKSFDMRREESL